MQRYFSNNRNLNLDDNALHHIVNVMRMKANDLIEIVYNKDVYLVKITSINPFKIEVLEKTSVMSNKKEVLLAFGLLKGDKIDYLLQKGTELGATSFIPLKMNRNVVKINTEDFKKKKERYLKICQEAAEQSKSNIVPNVGNIHTLEELFKIDADLKLVAILEENPKPLKMIITNSQKCDKIIIVTGPEGGITIEEAKYLIENGFTPVSLGKEVLRAETAPLFVLSAIKYEFME